MRTEIQYRFSRNTFWVTLLAVFFAITIALVIMNQKFDSEAILILILFGFCELLISLLFFQHMFYIITRRPALILDEEYITMHHFFGKRRAPIVMIMSVAKTRMPRGRQEMLSIQYLGKRNNPISLGILDEYKMSLDDIISVIEDLRAKHNMTDEYGIESIKNIKQEIDRITGNFYVIGIFTSFILFIGVLIGVILISRITSTFTIILAILYGVQILVLSIFSFLYYLRLVNYKKSKTTLLIIAVLSLIEIIVSIVLIVSM